MPAPTNGAPDRLSTANVRAVMEAWLARHDDDSFPWIIDPNRVEVPVAHELYRVPSGEHEYDGALCLCGHARRHHYRAKTACRYSDDCYCGQFQTTILFVGKLDLSPRLRRDPSILCVCDHKTTWRIDQRFVRQYQMDAQMTGYPWLCGKECGVPAHEIVGFINAIELSMVPNSTRKCPTHGVKYEECGPEHIKFQVIGPIERTEGQVERWRRDAVRLALRYRKLVSQYDTLGEGIDDLPTEGTFVGACRDCDCFEWCLADRPLQQVQHMFERRRWNPLEHNNIAPKDVDPEMFVVDNSTLKAMATCSTQALMRYGLGYTTNEHSGPLWSGTLVHHCLEAFFKTGSPQVALEAFDELVTEHVDEQP